MLSIGRFYGRVFNYRRHFRRTRDIDRVACALKFHGLLPARAAYHLSKSGLIVRSLAATIIQLGLPRHAGAAITAPKFSLKIGTCDFALNAASSSERSAAKYS